MTVERKQVENNSRVWLTTLPELKENMAANNITVVELSRRSGVSEDTITKARLGQYIRENLAEFVVEALDQLSKQK